MNSPCYNCKDRRLYCHGQCEDYKKYKSTIKRLKEDREYPNYFNDKLRRFGGARQI